MGDGNENGGMVTDTAIEMGLKLRTYQNYSQQNKEAIPGSSTSVDDAIPTINSMMSKLDPTVRAQ